MADIKKIMIGTDEYNLRDDSKAEKTAMGGATASADGSMGLVPKPVAGDQNKVLTGGGTWHELGTASSRNVDIAIVDESTSQNLPTSQAVASYFDSKLVSVSVSEKILVFIGGDTAIGVTGKRLVIT